MFVDIEPQTFNLDPDAVQAAITDRTKALLPVHLFGQACDMPALIELAARNNLPIIEDAAQAIGTQSPAGPVGGLGRLRVLFRFSRRRTSAGLATAAW